MPLAPGLFEVADGYVAAASLWVPDSGQHAAILKFDLEGDVSWAKRYTPGSGGVSSMDRLAGGGAVLMGAHFTVDEQRLWVLAVDEKGEARWMKSLGPAAGGRVRSVSGGGLVVATQARTHETGPSTAWVLRLDDAGDIRWQSSYPTGQETYISDVRQLRNGDILVVATTRTPGHDWDMWALRLLETGSIVWQRTFGGSGGDHGATVLESDDGSLFLVGTTSPPLVPGTTPILPNATVIKLSRDGEIVWQKALRGAATRYARSADLNAAGELVVAGSDRAFGGRAWLAGLDAEGELLWVRGYDGGSFGPEVLATSDGGYLLSASASANLHPPVLRKLDRSATGADSSCEIATVVEPTSLEARPTRAIPIWTSTVPVDLESRAWDVASVTHEPWMTRCEDEPRRSVARRRGRSSHVSRRGSRTVEPGTTRIAPRRTLSTGGDGTVHEARRVGAGAGPDRKSGKPFVSTLYAEDENRLAWKGSADVYFVAGPLDRVRAYEVARMGFLDSTTGLDISPERPVPAAGFYYLVRHAARGSWQTAPHRARGRDRALP
jgi:outer membrane protein assembly factor BamB